jgi:hypothetical protein
MTRLGHPVARRDATLRLRRIDAERIRLIEK